VVPFGVSLHLAKSLRVLDQSLDEGAEFPVPQERVVAQGPPARTGDIQGC
jgi:hypothetical protein